MSTKAKPVPATPSIRMGVDVGGSSVKAGLVDVTACKILGESLAAPTPQPATPAAIADLVGALLARLLNSGAGREIAQTTGHTHLATIGVALPTVVKSQHAQTAANIHPSWVGQDLPELFSRGAAPHIRHALGDCVDWIFLNDADAAGLAEFLTNSAPKLQRPTGNSLFLTFGTGIGSALFRGPHLFPNTELGHLPLRTPDQSGHHTAETWASAAVKRREALGYSEWAKRVSEVLNLYIALLNPEEVIIGGAISAEAEHWLPLLSVDAPAVRIRPARHFNDAGIVGAALADTADLRP